MKISLKQIYPRNEKIFGNGTGDWLEDLQIENGNYACECSICGQRFIGHKRRVVCKVCAEEKVEVLKFEYDRLIDIEKNYKKLEKWYWSREL